MQTCYHSSLIQKPHSKEKEIVAKTLRNELMSEHEQPLRYFTSRYDTAYQSTSELPEQLRQTGSNAPPWASYPGSAITYRGKLGKSLSLSKPLTSNMSWDLFFLLSYKKEVMLCLVTWLQPTWQTEVWSVLVSLWCVLFSLIAPFLTTLFCFHLAYALFWYAEL